MGKIDFIIPWVDGADTTWLASKHRYSNDASTSSQAIDANSACRYHDNGLLRYWFRCVETFAPWVNIVHFVSCEQFPGWLNKNHPKLNIVNHSDFIPKEYLPTFNANTIEMNFHRIVNLEEKYVYFNDDTFLLNRISPEFYFFNDAPILETDLRYTNKIGYNNWSRLLFNDYCIIKENFDTERSIWANRRKWFNIKELGVKRAVKNFLCFYTNRTLPVNLYGHIPLPHLKSTLKELWDKCPEEMSQMCTHKFRTDDQINQWVLCAWNQAKGQFYPTRPQAKGRNISITSDNIDWICRIIRNQELPQVCLNENEQTMDADRCYELIRKAFDEILPQKSSFELD